MNASELLSQRTQMPLIDVRSPSEYRQGHIPGAVNLPLFDDDERRIVGTKYKTDNREAAILAGLELCGPKLTGFVKEAARLSPRKKLMMYCWRGGMRSESMAWLFSLYGLEVFLLDGGYKAYRRYISEQWHTNARLIILSGKTGSGKSEILQILKSRGYQVIDLEQHAQHKGSAFGALGQALQPTNEQFENLLADDWLSFDMNQAIWVEDESRCIGYVNIPDQLFGQMHAGITIHMDMPLAKRIKRLENAYAHFPENLLIEGIEKIQRKLGGQHAKSAIEAIKQGDYATAIGLTLRYYDKAYDFDLTKKDPKRIFSFAVDTANEFQNVESLLSFCRQQQII